MSNALREVLRHYDERIEPSRSTGDMSAREWRDAYFELARIALKELEDCRGRIDVETLARAFVTVGMVIDGLTAAEARQMVERLAAEYEKLT
jgi:hypothetical protein